MSDNPLISRSGGIDLNSTTVSAQGDLVGRDKVVQNITILGQILNFALIADILPKPTTLPSFDNAYDAMEHVFNTSIQGDMISATSIASDLLIKTLGPFIRDERPGLRSKWRNFWLFEGKIPSLRYLISALPNRLYNELNRRNYWAGYSEPCDIQSSYIYLDKGAVVDSIRVIWLRATQFLWAKHLKCDKLYALSHVDQTIKHPDGTSYHRQWGTLFLVNNDQSQNVLREAQHSQGLSVGNYGKKFKYDLEILTPEECQLFLIGLFLDLIRLASTAQMDLLFWQDMLDRLSRKK